MACGIRVIVSYLGGDVRHLICVLVPSVSSPSGGRGQKKNRKDWMIYLYFILIEFCGF